MRFSIQLSRVPTEGGSVMDRTGVVSGSLPTSSMLASMIATVARVFLER